MKVVTANEMREIDRTAIEQYGILSLLLMERAGLAVSKRILEIFPQKKVIVLCGRGNNGGDGIVVARNLYNWGYKVKIIVLSKKEDLSRDCYFQLEIAEKLDIPIEFRDILTKEDLHGAILVDAVFGTGLSKPVTGKIADIFSFINESGVSVISIDMPSGISSDTGEILGEAIKADYTVTFGLPKRGHFLYPGAGYTGKLFIEDIGFPFRLLNSDQLKVELTTAEVVSGMIRKRDKYSHKGDYGHALIVAGSRGKTGAAIMTARSCMRSGSGMVTLAVPESLMNIFQGQVIEEMTLPLPDDNKGMLSSEALSILLDFIYEKGIDVIAIGPGIGISQNTTKIVKELLIRSTVPIVIDADGINSLCISEDGVKTDQVLRKAKSPVILTPHLGEMERLLKAINKNKQKRDIEKDRINTAIEFSKSMGVYLVLKGVPTIIAEPEERAFINTTGNPGMATAGAGDVLAGIITSFVGQGLNPLSASLLGVYIHGLSGDIARKRFGEHSLIASDIIDCICDAFKSLTIGKEV